MVEKWEFFGATCHGLLNWLHPKTLSVQPNYHQRKIREALEISFVETRAEFDSKLTVLNRAKGLKDMSLTHVGKLCFIRLVKFRYEVRDHVSQTHP